jgi:hypothetical protein
VDDLVPSLGLAVCAVQPVHDIAVQPAPDLAVDQLPALGADLPRRPGSEAVEGLGVVATKPRGDVGSYGVDAAAADHDPADDPLVIRAV